MSKAGDGLTLATGVPGLSNPVWILVMQMIPLMFCFIAVTLSKTESGRKSAVLLSIVLAWGTQLHPGSMLATHIPLIWDAGGSVWVLFWWYLAPTVLAFLALQILDPEPKTPPKNATLSATISSQPKSESGKAAPKLGHSTGRRQRGTKSPPVEANMPPLRRIRSIPPFVSEWSDSELVDRFKHLGVELEARVAHNRDYYNSYYVQLLAEKVGDE